jgi:hypothetical protein
LVRLKVESAFERDGGVVVSLHNVDFHDFDSLTGT